MGKETYQESMGDKASLKSDSVPGTPTRAERHGERRGDSLRERGPRAPWAQQCGAPFRPLG